MNRMSWIFIFASVVIIALISVFFIRPIATSSWQIWNQNKQAKQDLADAAKKKEILENLSKNNKLNTVYDIASNYIPKDQRSGDLVIELTAIAGQSNLKVEQLNIDSGTTSAKTTETDTSKSTPTSTSTPTANASNSDIKEIKFSMKVSGTFSDFLNFLKGTETSSRLITITSMSLTQTQNLLSAQVAGITYWNTSVALEKTLANIEIPQAIIDKFTQLKTYGSPINLPTESGFGRANPFVEY